ncbi:1-phosphatidylinositol-3-phosphate 5-kinase [Plasmodiophora brassicae]
MGDARDRSPTMRRRSTFTTVDLGAAVYDAVNEPLEAVSRWLSSDPSAKTEDDTKTMRDCGKSSWMPDQSCQTCYNCEASFSFFRRRHHCRLCGQIFCSSCSANTLGGVRVCDYCLTLKLGDSKPVTSMATRAVPDVPETTRSSPVDQACDEYIARIIKQRLRLLISELVVGAGAIDDTMGWTRQILRLATQATHMLKIRADLGDVRNVRFYTQVCIVDDGDVDKSHRLAGCVIGRTVAHKRMRTEIANPRIILLLCPLEYDRNPSRMSSLNTLIDAEMEYLKILVCKLMAHEPSLVVSHRSISGRALTMLVDAGVSCITNVPMNDLQRVSRCTGAPVLASLDQEMVAVGTCDLFRTGQLSNQTVTFFEGCNPLACSTIILFGVQSRADLYASIMLSAIEMAYTARCETAIEQDLLSQFTCLSHPDAPDSDLVAITGVDVSAVTAFRPELLAVRASSQCPGIYDGSDAAETPPETGLLSPSLPAYSRALLFERMLIAEGWPCQRGFDRIEFYSPADISLGEFLSEACLLSLFACGECKRGPMQHRVIFQHGEARLIAELSAREKLSPHVTTYSKCSACGHTTNPHPLSRHSLQLSFGRFLQMSLTPNGATGRSCQHPMRTHHTRYFSTGSLTLSLQYRPVATLTMCTAGKMLPFSGCDFGEPPVDYERVASFLESIMTRLDEIVSPDLQVEVELLRAELVNDLGRDHMTPTRFHRVVLSVILQLSKWKRAHAIPVDTSAVFPSHADPGVVIALALSSEEHAGRVAGISSLEDCATVLLNETDDRPITWTNGSRPDGESGSSCVIYFPKQFAAFRRWTIAGHPIEDGFAASLSACGDWATSGGKSGGTFRKSHDNRFVVKTVRKREFQMLLEMAIPYFRYMASTRSTILVPILGAFRVTVTRDASPQYLVVSSNLLFGKPNVSRVFDLKGSIRSNRADHPEPPDHVQPPMEDPKTLLDGDLLQYTKGVPISLTGNSLADLRLSVQNDTEFLSGRSVVDYSILIGVDEIGRTISVGIIDYLRVYTLDARLESQVKSLGMLAGRPLPTVIAPVDYMQRFRRAVDCYFGSAMPVRTFSAHRGSALDT